MGIRAWGWLVLGTGLVVAVSCSDDVTGVDKVCTPGETQPCLGPGQCEGAQPCNDSGSGWEACECGSGGVGGSTGGTGGAPGGTGGAGGQGALGGQGGNGGTVVGGGTPTGGGGSPTGGGTPSGTTACTGQVDIGFGETAACQSCIEQNCCSEYLQCANGSTSADCDGLFDCGRTGLCSGHCHYPICGSAIGHTFFKTCRDCTDANCCTQFNACIGDVNCENCLQGVNEPTSCDSTTLDEDYDNCMATNCSDADCPGMGSGGGGG